MPVASAQPGPQGKRGLAPLCPARTARQACLPSGLLCGPWLAGAVGKELQEGGPAYAPTPEVGFLSFRSLTFTGPFPLWLQHGSPAPTPRQWGNLQSWCPGPPVSGVDQGIGGRACCPAVPRSLVSPNHASHLNWPGPVANTRLHTLTFGPAAHPEELTTQPHIPQVYTHVVPGFTHTRVTYSHGNHICSIRCAPMLLIARVCAQSRA